MINLHLGCGQKYLEGYVNIDLPMSGHRIPVPSVADEHADITQLRYRKGEVDEVRLHHVFEHFTRPVACGLLASWYSWLKPGGTLHIEVPDFQKTARIMLRRYAPFKRRAVAERHLFGSHEAGWAVHCDGYTSNTMVLLLSAYKFKTIEIKKNSWMGTHNFEVLARKNGAPLMKSDFSEITRTFLANYLLDESESEQRVLAAWMEIYHEQVEKCWAYND